MAEPGATCRHMCGELVRGWIPLGTAEGWYRSAARSRAKTFELGERACASARSAKRLERSTNQRRKQTCGRLAARTRILPWSAYQRRTIDTCSIRSASRVANQPVISYPRPPPTSPTACGQSRGPWTAQATPSCFQHRTGWKAFALRGWKGQFFRPRVIDALRTGSGCWSRGQGCWRLALGESAPTDTVNKGHNKV